MKQLTIRNNGDVAEVLLYDTIGEDMFFGGVSAKTFREQVRPLSGRTINLRVNSPGGDVFAASAMLQTLDEHDGRIEVDIDGLAASAASYLVMAGDVVRIASTGMMMIHDPYAMAAGGAAEMRRTADTLDKVKEQILDTYRRRPNAQARKKLAAMMAAETWLTGSEAVDAGLADEVTKAQAIAAMATALTAAARLGYRHAPEPPKADMTETLRLREIVARLYT